MTIKPKLLLIGHSHHKTTNSNKFFIEFLQNFFDIEICYDTSLQNGLKVSDKVFLKYQYHHIIFYQISPYKNILKNKNFKKIIFIPMYDSCNFKEIVNNYFKFYKKITFINFSKKFHNKLLEFGLNTYYFQYFPAPEKKQFGDLKELFFWQRRNIINFTMIDKLFTNYQIIIHHHIAPDPNIKLNLPTVDQKTKYNITTSNWFKNRKEFLSEIANKAFFIAPRLKEGIGMSFLEAMAMGKIVIANNDATMNEYIEHGVNGYLFDYKNPQPIDFKNLHQIQENAYQTIVKGYEKWQNEKKIIIEIINDQLPKIQLNPYQIIQGLILRKSCFFYFKILKILNNILCIIVVNKKLKNKIRNKHKMIEQNS